MVVIDQDDNPIFRRRLPNDLDTTLRMLEPYQEHLQDIAVESTFNWYWLNDGLMDIGYRVHLVNGVGNYASYCRCVDSRRMSNRKIKAKAMPRMATNT